MSFDAPGCARPVQVASLDISLERGLVLQFIGVPGDSRRYAYIDRVWTEPQRFSVFRERVKHAALAVVGLSRYVPSHHMLLIDSPPECRAADPIDWRLAWDRDFLASGRQAAAKPAR